MADLTTEYLGLQLPSPLVLASSALSNRLENLEAAEGHGAGAIVLRSLFEEQIEAANTELEEAVPAARRLQPGGPHLLPAPADRAARVPAPPGAGQEGGPHPGHRQPQRCAPGSWTDYAKQIADAGADAIEVNIYAVEADPSLTGAEVERRYVEAVAGIQAAVKIPVAVKLSPYFTSLANVVAQLRATGVDGLVLFNRFLQPDIALERMAPNSVMSLSPPSETLLPLRWIGLLHGRVQLDLAASTGVHDTAGALKQLLAGATVVQLASTLSETASRTSARCCQGIEEWMERRGHSSIDEFRGTLSQKQVSDPGAFERAQYVHLILSQNI